MPVFVCKRCGEETDVDAKGAQQLTCLCGGCNSCGAKLSKLNIGVAQFTSMPDAEKQEFWKKARGLSKTALQTYCEDTLTKSRSASTSSITKSKPMPLKYYEDMGFDGQFIKDNTPPEDISTVHGTTCYSLPLSMFVGTTTDETKRSQTLVSTPKSRTTSAVPKVHKSKLPQEGVDRSEWSEEHVAAFAKHVEDVAGKELAEIDAKLAGDFAPHLPAFVKDAVFEYKAVLEGDIKAAVLTHADLKALKEKGATIKTHLKAYKTAFDKYGPLSTAPGTPAKVEGTGGKVAFGKSAGSGSTAKAKASKAKAKRATGKAKAKAKAPLRRLHGKRSS